jgi:hypothetical protein
MDLEDVGNGVPEGEAFALALSALSEREPGRGPPVAADRNMVLSWRGSSTSSTSSTRGAREPACFIWDGRRGALLPKGASLGRGARTLRASEAAVGVASFECDEEAVLDPSFRGGGGRLGSDLAEEEGRCGPFELEDIGALLLACARVDAARLMIGGVDTGSGRSPRWGGIQ